MMLLIAGLTSTAPNPAPVQTLCILDFHRLGDDARADWLEQGLADMMINTMHSLSPYLVIERKHLKDILREHGLAQSGLVDIGTAVRQAQLAKAQLLLQGSFARQGDELTIQVRLIRVSDQRIVTQATWIDRYSKVLFAPRALSEKLQANLGNPLDPEKLGGIEKQIPATIDVAKSYYQGVRAFDDGHYPEALAHYLDAARQAGDFRKAYPAVLEMYYLLGRSEHAVLFARELARSYEERGDVPGALEYYFAAAQECLDPLSDLRSGVELLEKLLRLLVQHEQKTGEIAKTKRSVQDRIDELQRMRQHDDFGKILADRDIRYQMWFGDIKAELTRRAEEQARGGYAVLEDGKWVKRPVPKPSVLMWKIRARHTLAQAYARSGEINPALDQYRDLLAEYEFLTRYSLYDGRLLSSLKTEAHFMLLRHYAKTGRLIRDHAMNRINRLNVVSNRLVFTRDFRSPAPDERARVASRHKGRSHEYFDFAAPPGHRIDSLALRVNVAGIAEFGFDLPHTAGWPPQYSFSKRLERFKFSEQGTYQRTIVPPAGTEFLSVGTGWGPGLFSNTQAEVDNWKLNGPKDGPDIVRWEVSFAISPKSGVMQKKAPGAESPLDPAVQKMIDRYAAGWERAYVVRDAQTVVYSGHPRLDVFAEDWLVNSLDGDVRIFRQRDPRVEINLPIAINSREHEFDPSLVRTHDGRYALLWARGTSRNNAIRFVAFSVDLLRWETPQRLVFEEPPGNIGYTYAQAEPLERTFNVVSVRRGYAMLLAQGFVRHSEDLRNWGPPRKAIPQDLAKNRLFKGRDGTVWAVYESSSNELQAYTQDDWLHGYFVIDGKRYRHVTELRVSRTVDGIKWEATGTVVFPGQPSGLWVFALDERQIGIAVGFNNLYVKWLTGSSLGDLRQIDSQLQLQFMHQSEEAECFVRDASLTCIRAVLDFEKQKPMLLATSTERLLGGSRKK
jgi:tetratricopeptide (TPR) repeat protein